MEIIELTSENIEQYLDACTDLQTHLVKSKDSIESHRFVDTASDSCGYFMGVLNDEQQLVGMGLVSKVMDPVRVIGYVNNVVIHPDARGQGLFSVIMDDLETKAKEWGCERMELTCSRPEVQTMYEKRGYIKKDTKFYIQKI
jgi:GNAT superfamily N-acetyltransferase